MNIYISHYFSNESLCGFLMVLVMLVTMMILNNPHSSAKLFCVLGLIIGLALLTKVTMLTILPVIFLVLSYKLLSEQEGSLGRLADYLGLMLFLIVVVAGWFYLRNLAHFGKPFVNNWDRSLGFHWWQDPGFHTYKYFCRFGKVFSLPYFIGFYSFFDSLYSTFWGDSFVGGVSAYAHRTPWNEEYMSAVYLLSLPATPIIIIGTLCAIRNAVFAASKIWLLILGSLLIMAYSLIYMNLKMPYYSVAKTFYFMAVLLPISLIFACGFDYLDKWLRGKSLSILRATLYGWFGTLALAIFFAFLDKDLTV